MDEDKLRELEKRAREQAGKIANEAIKVIRFNTVESVDQENLSLQQLEMIAAKHANLIREKVNTPAEEHVVASLLFMIVQDHITVNLVRRTLCMSKKK